MPRILATWEPEIGGGWEGEGGDTVLGQPGQGVHKTPS
jgi:hypothetical protein